MSAAASVVRRPPAEPSAPGVVVEVLVPLPAGVNTTFAWRPLAEDAGGLARDFARSRDLGELAAALNRTATSRTPGQRALYGGIRRHLWAVDRVLGPPDT